MVDSTRIGSAICLSIDLSNSVGYHYLKVDDDVFPFATEDGKLLLRGMMSIIEVLGELGLSLGKQLFFADGDTAPSGYVQFAWLWQNTSRICTVLESVCRSPGSQLMTKHRVSPMLNSVLDVPKTASFLLRNPQFLTERADGMVALSSGKRYTPEFVVLKRRRDSIDTDGNRRALLLALRTIALANTLGSIFGWEKLDSIRPAIDRLRAIVRRQPLRNLMLSPRRGVALNAGSDELTDPRYRFILQKLLELRQSGWNTNESLQQTFFSFVKHSDELYQSFVAIVIADALGCTLNRPLRSHQEGPAFVGPDFDIYYDTVPPANILSTWRSVSVRQDRPRPDVLVYHKASGHSLIIDAKYRNAGNDASPESLSEVQYYLNTFEKKDVVVCYPPSDIAYRELTSVSGRGYEILEVPIAPSVHTREFMQSVVRPKLLEMIVR
jgi:hypothetical protein